MTSTPQNRDVGRRGIIKAPVAFLDKTATDSSPAIELLTIPEVAWVLKISVTGVRRLKDAGHLPFHKVGGSVRFSKRDLVSYLEKSRVEAVD
jgi:excisionase family DNA binding protein